jgi:hypothetical protein
LTAHANICQCVSCERCPEPDMRPDPLYTHVPEWSGIHLLEFRDAGPSELIKPRIIANDVSAQCTALTPPPSFPPSIMGQTSSQAQISVPDMTPSSSSSKFKRRTSRLKCQASGLISRLSCTSHRLKRKTSIGSEGQASVSSNVARPKSPISEKKSSHKKSVSIDGSVTSTVVPPYHAPAKIDPAKIDPTFADFIRRYPQYCLTWMLDGLRQEHFERLGRSGEAYVDYMGGSLYPDMLVHQHAALLHQSVLGNTHSINNRYGISGFDHMHMAHRIY